MSRKDRENSRQSTVRSAPPVYSGGCTATEPCETAHASRRVFRSRLQTLSTRERHGATERSVKMSDGTVLEHRISMG